MPTIAVGEGNGRVRMLIATAVTEWHRWGSLDVDRLPTGEPCACFASGRCVPIDDGCGREQQSGWCPIVNEYWARTFVVSGRWFQHDCSRVDVCDARWPSASAPIDTPAWSAAFISTMMDRAGLADDEFLKTPYHADYVRAAYEGRTSGHRVIPVPAPVSPGDLVCSLRGDLRPARHGPYAFGALAESGLPWFGPGGAGPQTAAIRIAALLDSRHARRPTPMHCDLVVAIDGNAGEALAIGGNVMQSVARVRYRLDAGGRVFAGGGGAAPLLVMRLRRPAPDPGDSGTAPTGR